MVKCLLVQFRGSEDYCMLQKELEAHEFTPDLPDLIPLDKVTSLFYLMLAFYVLASLYCFLFEYCGNKLHNMVRKRNMIRATRRKRLIDWRSRFGSQVSPSSNIYDHHLHQLRLTSESCFLCNLRPANDGLKFYRKCNHMTNIIVVKKSSSIV